MIGFFTFNCPQRPHLYLPLATKSDGSPTWKRWSEVWWSEVWCVALFCGEVGCVVLFGGEVKCGEVKCGVVCRVVLWWSVVCCLVLWWSEVWWSEVWCVVVLWWRAQFYKLIKYHQKCEWKSLSRSNKWFEVWPLSATVLCQISTIQYNTILRDLKVMSFLIPTCSKALWSSSSASESFDRRRKPWNTERIENQKNSKYYTSVEG